MYKSVEYHFLAGRIAGWHEIMQERPFISSFAIIEQTTDRLAFDVTINLKFFFKRILVPFGVIEGILVGSFVILLLTGILIRDPVILIMMITLIAMFAGLLIIIPWLSKISTTSIVLDRKSGTFSILSQFTKQRYRALNSQFSYPLDTLKSLEMIHANELKGPGMSILRGMFKGMYLLRFKRYLPMRYQRNPRASPMQGPFIMFADSQPERVQELKTIIEEFLNSSSNKPGYSNEKQSLPPTNFPENLACPRCGYKYSGSTKISFCPNCGESLENT